MAIPERRALEAGSRRVGSIPTELGQDRALSLAQRATIDRLSGRQGIGGGPSRPGEPNPALIPWAARGAEQGPIEGRQALIGERAHPSKQPRTTLRRDEVADRSGPMLQLVQQVAVRRREPGRWLARGPFGDELEALEQARREHRPDDERRRGEVVIRDPDGEPEGQRRQQRPVGPNPRGDRLRLDPIRALGFAQDDAQRLPPAELDEDRLARRQVGELRRHEVRVGPAAAAAGGVDRDGDVTRDLTRRRRPDVERRVHLVRYTRTRRVGWSVCSVAMIASIFSAVCST